MLKKKKAVTDATPPANAPPTALEPKMIRAWFEAYGKPVVDRNRMVLAVLALSGGIGAMALALASLMPLKTIQPYVIYTDNAGRIAADPVGAKQYRPDWNAVRYFLANWATKAMSVEPGLTRRNLEEAFRFLRDGAPTIFTEEIITRRKPIERTATEPTLSDLAQVIAINPIDDKTVLMRVRTTEYTKTKPGHSKIENYSLTVRYEIAPPTTEEEIMRNPLGIYITHFSLTRELK